MLNVIKEKWTKCTCGRPAMRLHGVLTNGTVRTQFVVSICLKSGFPISECPLQTATDSDVQKMEAALRS